MRITAIAVGELIHTAFRLLGGVGDAEAVILRHETQARSQFQETIGAKKVPQLPGRHFRLQLRAEDHEES
jgi:hypothetical protein